MNMDEHLVRQVNDIRLSCVCARAPDAFALWICLFLLSGTNPNDNAFQISFAIEFFVHSAVSVSAEQTIKF